METSPAQAPPPAGAARVMIELARSNPSDLLKRSRLMMLRLMNSAGIARRRNPLRIILGIDFRRAIFIRPTIHDWLLVEITVSGRAWSEPLQAVRAPRIAAHRRAEKYAA